MDTQISITSILEEAQRDPRTQERTRQRLSEVMPLSYMNTRKVEKMDYKTYISHLIKEAEKDPETYARTRKILDNPSPLHYLSARDRLRLAQEAAEYPWPDVPIEDNQPLWSAMASDIERLSDELGDNMASIRDWVFYQGRLVTITVTHTPTPNGKIEVDVKLHVDIFKERS